MLNGSLVKNTPLMIISTYTIFRPMTSRSFICCTSIHPRDHMPLQQIGLDILRKKLTSVTDTPKTPKCSKGEHTTVHNNHAQKNVSNVHWTCSGRAPNNALTTNQPITQYVKHEYRTLHNSHEHALFMYVILINHFSMQLIHNNGIKQRTFIVHAAPCRVISRVSVANVLGPVLISDKTFNQKIT